MMRYFRHSALVTTKFEEELITIQTRHNWHAKTPTKTADSKDIIHEYGLRFIAHLLSVSLNRKYVSGSESLFCIEIKTLCFHLEKGERGTEGSLELAARELRMAPKPMWLGTDCVPGGVGTGGGGAAGNGWQVCCWLSQGRAGVPRGEEEVMQWKNSKVTSTLRFFFFLLDFQFISNQLWRKGRGPLRDLGLWSTECPVTHFYWRYISVTVYKYTVASATFDTAAAVN